MRASPLSQLGRLAPTASVGEGRILYVLKSYFDKSGDEAARFVTLCGAAAIDTEWQNIESIWKHALEVGDPKAAYMHMNEAVFLKREFCGSRGWTDQKVDDLVDYLVSCITTFDKEKFIQFICTVDMEAYRKLQAESYQMDSVVDICNEWCVEQTMGWYIHHYKGLDFEASYYFDTNEPFEPVFKAKWHREMEKDRITGRCSAWSSLKHVGEVPMRSTPGIQIADMLAWGQNRGLIKDDIQRVRCEHMALALTRLAPTMSILWDEARLRKEYRPLIYKPYEKY